MKRINIYEEANRCLMCQEAPCTIACKTGDPARAIRAIRFDNHKLATRWVAACSDADLEAAEKACIRFDGPIPLKGCFAALVPMMSRPTIPVWKSTSAASTARIPSSWPPRQCAPTMRWWRVPLRQGGLVCSIRPSAYRRSRRCRPVSMPFTAMGCMANSMVSAIWSS